MTKTYSPNNYATLAGILAIYTVMMFCGMYVIEIFLCPNEILCRFLHAIWVTGLVLIQCCRMYYVSKTFREEFYFRRFVSSAYVNMESRYIPCSFIRTYETPIFSNDMSFEKVHTQFWNFLDRSF